MYFYHTYAIIVLWCIILNSYNLSARIIVVSDKVYRGEAEDKSGSIAIKELSEKGFIVKEKIVVPNDYKSILTNIIKAAGDADVIVVIGGTGPSPRDISVDVVEKLAWRSLPGFGEVFRIKTWEEEGAAAFFTRAGMYLVGNSVVVVLPGSPNAVRLGVELLSKAAKHVVEECRRVSGTHKKPEG